MSLNRITPRYTVSPQIMPEDLPEIAAAGIKTVICNRPDVEVPGELRSDVIRIAAEAAGLKFEVLELTHQTMTPENIARQRAIIEGAEGPVLAYCASGTRSTVAWALGQAGRMPTDAILAAAAAGGYQLDGLRPTLDSLAANAG